jgi:hypothetical protein
MFPDFDFTTNPFCYEYNEDYAHDGVKRHFTEAVCIYFIKLFSVLSPEQQAVLMIVAKSIE